MRIRVHRRCGVARRRLLALPVASGQAAEAAKAAGALAPKCKGREVTILGTDAAETLRGTNKRDVILGLDGDDRIDGRGGNDVICGGAGRDLVKGGPGHDKIFGGADGRSEQRNPDGVRLMVGDVVQGGPGDDLIDLGLRRAPADVRFGPARSPVLQGLRVPRRRHPGHPEGSRPRARRRPRPPRQAPLPRPARLRQARRAHRVDVRRPDPRPRRTRPRRRRWGPRRPGRRPDRCRASATTCSRAASAATS